MPSLDKIHAIFELLGQGKTGAFFENIVDDVDWTVKGIHYFLMLVEATLSFKPRSS
jgi:hypothetical protein